jgi:hypothetical protein
MGDAQLLKSLQVTFLSEVGVPLSCGPLSI